MSGIPRIRYPEPRDFLRALGRLGGVVSIADRDAIMDLTGWEPELKANPGTGGVRAETDQRTLDSDITHLLLGVVPSSLENEKGAFQLQLRPDRYCIQFDDVVSVFGKPTQFHGPSLHAQLPPRVTNTYGVDFVASKMSRLRINFEYQKCANTLSVIKYGR